MVELTLLHGRQSSMREARRRESLAERGGFEPPVEL